MTRRNINQAGFSAVELILVLVIVGAIVSLGLYVHHSLQHISSTYNAATKTSSGTSPKFASKKTATATTQYLDIMEWGVRAPYTGSTDLSYNVMASNPNAAWVNSRQLANADPACKIAPDSGNAGYIGRYLPTDSVSTGATSESAEQYLSQDFAGSNTAPPHYSKVGDYYYIYWTGQAPCTANSSLLTQVTSDVGNIVKNFEAVPN